MENAKKIEGSSGARDDVLDRRISVAPIMDWTDDR
jgi:hypothetical protein